jgi:hypothetical protein
MCYFSLYHCVLSLTQCLLYMRTNYGNAHCTGKLMLLLSTGCRVVLVHISGLAGRETSCACNMQLTSIPGYWQVYWLSYYDLTGQAELCTVKSRPHIVQQVTTTGVTGWNDRTFAVHASARLRFKSHPCLPNSYIVHSLISHPCWHLPGESCMLRRGRCEVFNVPLRAAAGFPCVHHQLSACTCDSQAEQHQDTACMSVPPLQCSKAQHKACNCDWGRRHSHCTGRRQLLA